MKKHFEFDTSGEDELYLLFPSVKSLKTIHNCIEILLDTKGEDPDTDGLYISNIGTFKNHHP